VAAGNVRRGVVVIAAEPLFRAGLVATLQESFVVQGAASTAHAGQRLLTTFHPPLSVLVLTPALVDAAPEVASNMLIAGHPATATLVLLHEPDRSTVWLAGRNGARGIYDTMVEPAQLATILSQIADGEFAVQPSLVRFLVEGEPDAAENRSETALTERELMALQLLARGYTSKMIAGLLGTTPKAVDLTIERATRRLGASHRAQAIATAMRRGLLS
jgi:DNA-binding NarL/FixJ family response regulator